MQKIITLIILSVLISSCHQKQSDRAIHNIASVEAEMIPVPQSHNVSSEPPVPIDVDQVVNKKKIIKDGQLGLRVQELERTKLFVDTLLKNINGYYANESFVNTDWESSYNLKIRIPSSAFELFISEIETGDGEILYKEIQARDVTDQFIDLEIRLENKRNYLKRYNDLLKQAKSVKEILEIEEKIRGLEEEIESTTGRLKYLVDLVDFSTLDLTISKRNDFKYNPTIRDNFLERLKQSLSKGWFGFIDLLLFMIKIWPIWIILVMLFFIWRKFKKRKIKN